MKCSTINFVQLFILTLTVIGSCLANASKSISQLERNESTNLMPKFRESLQRWMDIKKKESKLRPNDNINATYMDCSLCKISVDSVQIFSRLHMDRTVASIVRNVCTYFHIETADVCKGIVNTFNVSSFLFWSSFFCFVFFLAICVCIS